MKVILLVVVWIQLLAIVSVKGQGDHEVPGPVSNLRVTTPTTTTLPISWTVSGSIDRFEVTYNYTVKRCYSAGAPRTDTISAGSARSHTLRDLNEDSNYNITVRAINTIGSTMATVTADTLISAPTGSPRFLSFRDINVTSITVQWRELECSDRNGEITGYTVEYYNFLVYPVGPQTIVSGSSNTSLVVGGLIPRTYYNFTVSARGSTYRTSSALSTAIPTEVGFFLNGKVLSNNSRVLLSDIGDIGNSALFCLTNRKMVGGGPYGLWRFPDGSEVRRSALASLNQIRRFTSLLLYNRRSIAVGPTGVYTCSIRDARYVFRTIYITIDANVPTTDATPAGTEAVEDTVTVAVNREMPDPVSNLQVTTPTSTTLSISWTVSGSIDRFDVTYSYVVNRCSAPQGAPRTDTISDGSMRSHTLRDLNEDSSYTITVRAINTVGSTMATVTANTLTSAPTGSPRFLSYRDINVTSITVQWRELECSNRNGEITGYRQ